MKDFKKLIVWQKSMILVKDIYLIAKQLPQEEKFGFYSQITRAAISIPSNIAEGSSRHTQKEFKRFLEIALGSSFEVETQLLLIEKLKLADDELLTIINQTCEVQKMLQGLMSKLVT
ncbi:four helix bundle protein [Labilibaculum sp.]|uniref:four helix bundle protein n=1 Tax=Labilibaculum sp. TaxID=2060723 RepID=UPI003562FDF7